jgi:hypothetical protein
LVKPNANIYSQGIQRILFHIFLSLISFSMNFRILKEFLEKDKSTMRAGPHLAGPYQAGLAAHGKNRERGSHGTGAAALVADSANGGVGR